MATVEQLNDIATTITTGLDDLAASIAAEGVQVAAEFQSLKDQIAAGGKIDPAALDSVAARFAGIAERVVALKTPAEAIFTPDAPPA